MGPKRAKAKSWTLLANFADKTLLRNAVAACIGDFAGQPFTAGAQFVDLVLNGTYLGNYQLSDQMEVRKKRVDIDEQDEIPTEDANITGGYFLEVDGWATAEPVYYKTNRNVLVTVKSPDEEVIVSRQLEYIKNHMQLFGFCGSGKGISSLCGFLDSGQLVYFDRVDRQCRRFLEYLYVQEEG